MTNKEINGNICTDKLWKSGEKMEIYAFENLLQKNGISYRQLADLCEMEFSVLQSRMRGESEFTLGEIERIVNCLSMDKSEIMLIFFDS